MKFDITIDFTPIYTFINKNMIEDVTRYINNPQNMQWIVITLSTLVFISATINVLLYIESKHIDKNEIENIENKKVENIENKKVENIENKSQKSLNATPDTKKTNGGDVKDSKNIDPENANMLKVEVLRIITEAAKEVGIDLFDISDTESDKSIKSNKPDSVKSDSDSDLTEDDDSDDNEEEESSSGEEEEEEESSSDDDDDDESVPEKKSW